MVPSPWIRYLQSNRGPSLDAAHLQQGTRPFSVPAGGAPRVQGPETPEPGIRVRLRPVRISLSDPIDGAPGDRPPQPKARRARATRDPADPGANEATPGETASEPEAPGKPPKPRRPARKKAAAHTPKTGAETPSPGRATRSRKTTPTRRKTTPRTRKRPAAKPAPAPEEDLEELSVAEEIFDLSDDEPGPEPPVRKLAAVESIEDALEALQAEAAELSGLQEDEDLDLEPEEDLEIPTGPIFEGEVSLDTPEQRLDAMRKAALRLGIRQLYPEQEEVIETALGGKDVMMILPTGFGKSACYQIPSMILPRPVVVISPLLALMQDQYDKLQKLGVPCVRLDGTIRGRARKEALDRIVSGERLLVMTTPETLAAPDAAEALTHSGVSLAAVDEAHCISEWGYDFRPAYLQIGERLRAMGAPPVIALTATATEKVRLAIIRFVGMREPHVVASSPHRSNLAFDVLHCAGGQRLRALARLALRVRRPGIIYCSTTREVDELWAVLKRFGVPCHRYHGKMTAADRRKNQNAFMQRGRRTVMVATNAFGLGIDKQDIRYVLHYQSPASLEQYVQEAGRAGRDGRRANCILLFSSEDRAIHEALLSRSRVRPEQLYRLAKALAAWAKEEKAPSLQALALSAELGVRTCGALLALLEEATLVKWDTEAVFVTVPPDDFEPRARELAGQFETLRTQDARRLDAVADYALATTCRATFLREYFGEDGGEPCGMCDVCRGQADRPNSFWEPLAPPKGEERRRRGRSGRATTTGRRRGQKGQRGRKRGRKQGGQARGRRSASSDEAQRRRGGSQASAGRRPADGADPAQQAGGEEHSGRRRRPNGAAAAAESQPLDGSNGKTARKRRRRGSRGRRRRGRGRGPSSPEPSDRDDAPSPPPSS